MDKAGGRVTGPWNWWPFLDCEVEPSLGDVLVVSSAIQSCGISTFFSMDFVFLDTTAQGGLYSNSCNKVREHSFGVKVGDGVKALDLKQWVDYKQRSDRTSTTCASLWRGLCVKT